MNASYYEYKTTTRNAFVSHQEYIYKLDELCAHIHILGHPARNPNYDLSWFAVTDLHLRTGVGGGGSYIVSVSTYLNES